MKISKISTLTIYGKLKKEFNISGAKKTKDVEHVLVVVHSDSGLYGIGEAPPKPNYSEETVDSVKFAIKNYISPSLIGADPHDYEKVWNCMNNAICGNYMAKAAIEHAIYDLRGKDLGVPVYKLLGGLERDSIPIVWGIGIAKTIDMVNEALKGVSIGFKQLKIKIGDNPRKDIENIQAIRKEVGDKIPIRVDANQGYSLTDALYILPKIEKYNIELCEQPISRYNLEGLARIRNKINMPLMVDESIFSLEDVINVIKFQAADVINIKVAKTGLLQSKRIAAVAESAGLGCMVGSMVEMDIATSVGEQFIAATRNITFACETGGPLQYENIIVESPSFSDRFVDGFVKISHKPGLGIHLRKDLKEKLGLL